MTVQGCPVASVRWCVQSAKRVSDSHQSEPVVMRMATASLSIHTARGPDGTEDRRRLRGLYAPATVLVYLCEVPGPPVVPGGRALT